MPSAAFKSKLPVAGRLLFFLGLLFVFLVAIELMAVSMESAGADAAKSLLQSLDNPFAGLAVGVLATVLVQSSSVTTSAVVALVATGKLSLGDAVPVVMGANIGTSITSTLVSLGHVTRSDEFRRAFAGATVHDFFNLIAVAILLPLEMATGFLQHTAQWLASVGFRGTSTSFQNPVTNAIKAAAEAIHQAVASIPGLAGGWLVVVLLALALAMIIFALMFITKVMKSLLADRIEQWMNQILARKGMLGPLIGISIGMLTTAAVQSSSITTSLLVPMFGAGVLTLEAGFPIVVGANLGTTITALLAASITNQAGMAIALVHFLFNASATVILVPFGPIRQIPLNCARGLANAAAKNRLWVLVYLGTVFVLLPILGILIWGD